MDIATTIFKGIFISHHLNTTIVFSLYYYNLYSITIISLMLYPPIQGKEDSHHHSLKGRGIGTTTL